MLKIKSLYLSLISILLLSLGWLGVSGLTMLVAFVPLLIISSRAERSRRGWWGVFGWALFTFVGWNLSTIWWIGFATPVGPFAATLASTFVSMMAFMPFHTVTKYAPKSLSYTLLVTLWIAMEYIYTIGDFSWPWLLIGNGFSNDIWAVQWYEFTGIFGGSLWVLISNIAIFEMVRGGDYSRGRLVRVGSVVLLPILCSLVIFLSYNSDDREQMQLSVIQPNVDAYAKFNGRYESQESNIIDLLDDVPEGSSVIALPETAIPRMHYKNNVARYTFINKLRKLLKEKNPGSTIISGINCVVTYSEGEQSETARQIPNTPEYIDYFNCAVAIDTLQRVELRDKAKLVIGVENTPTWVFKLFQFFVIDIGGVVGQIAQGVTAEPFEVDGHSVGAAICYEALYGDFYAGFVRNGAQIMTIISNDGWWRDTPGHRHLYSISSLRAIETRRAIARSANTGTSGFIDERGVSIESLGWDKRGVITHSIPLNDYMTTYVRYGDYIARISVLLALLSILNYIALRAKQRHNLI